MRYMNLLLAIGFLVTLLVGGCGNDNKDPRAKYFFGFKTLETVISPVKSDYILKVQDLKISQEFDSREMVISTESGQYQKDYYNQFVVGPDNLFTGLTQQWFANSGYFKASPPLSSILDADYVLEGNITKLYGDFSTESAKAIIEVQFFLIDTKTREHKLVINKTFNKKLILEDNTAKVLVNAYQKLWREILVELEKEIISVL